MSDQPFEDWPDRGPMENAHLSLLQEMVEWYIEVEKKASPLIAFVLLFKLHYVTNMKFADSLPFSYNSIKTYFYKTNNTTMSSIKLFHSSLKDMNLSTVTDWIIYNKSVYKVWKVYRDIYNCNMHIYRNTFKLFLVALKFKIYEAKVKLSFDP